MKIDGLFADRPLGFELFDGLDFSIHHQAELAPRRAREAIDEIEAPQISSSKCDTACYCTRLCRWGFTPCFAVTHGLEYIKVLGFMS